VQTAESLRDWGYDAEIVLVDADVELPYNRPPLSKELLTGELDEDDIRLLTAAQVSELDITLHLGARAHGLKKAEKLVDTDVGMIGFDALVVATGAVPVLPESWAALDGVTALRTLKDARAIRAALGASPRVVVVGGGFIGCEIAASIRQLGGEVTIVEGASSLMARALAPPLAERISRLHERRGVVVRCGSPVAELRGSRKVEEVVLADGTRLEANLVIVGLGARPATDWLAASGLDVRDGICTDASLCAAPGIYAVGDVVRYDDGVTPGGRRVEHWASAREHGVLAAANLLHPASARSVSGTPFIWSDQHGSRIQIVGTGSDDHLRFGSGTDEDGGFAAFVGDAERVTGMIAFDRPRQFRHGRRLVEAHADWETVRSVQW
jgi:NADPH-dependent 2,4-dienoyl-CoA reductase/sulfur reductase-like enzyme